MPELLGSVAPAAFLQALVFAAPALLVYAVTRRRVAGFGRYVGLYWPQGRTMALAAGLVLLAFPLAWLQDRFFPLLREGATGPLSPLALAARARAEGLWGDAAAALLLKCLVANGFAEEVFFRGFLGKRLSLRWGFAWGNAAQALIFGGVHLGLFLLAVPGLTPAYWVYILFFPSLLGWAFGWMNEKAGNGSILPSWGAHGLMNFVSALLLAGS